MPYREEPKIARRVLVFSSSPKDLAAIQKLLDDGWTIESITPAPTDQWPYWLIILRRTP